MASRNDSRPLYVIGPVWHLVDGAGADAPHQGRIFALRCYRWIPVSEAEGRGLHRGQAPGDAPICGDCLRFRVAPPGDGAFDDVEGEPEA